jgi:hypothetical protein
MNRHPADALADVREEIRQLEEREQVLRLELLRRGGGDRIGDEWEAQVRHFEQQRLDTAAVIRHFGRNALREFFKNSVFDAIYLKKRRHVAVKKSPAMGEPADRTQPNSKDKYNV